MATLKDIRLRIARANGGELDLTQTAKLLRECAGELKTRGPSNDVDRLWDVWELEHTKFLVRCHRAAGGRLR